MPTIPPRPPTPEFDPQGRIKQLEAEKRELQTRLDAGTAAFAEAEATRRAAETANAALEQRATASEERLTVAQDALAKAQTELRDQEGELGRLRAIAETVDAVRADLDTARSDANAVRAQLAEATAEFDKRVAEQVQAALDRVTKEHEVSATEWEQQRARLETRIKELEAAGVEGPRPSVAPEATAVRTSDLASQFRNVLDKLAEPAPSDAPVGAALTNLEVEARGLLAAPAEGEDLPRLIPVDPAGAVNPEALSTVRLRFGLLPRLPTEVEQPPPDTR
jgi:chromosome segregation ATPase